jgi:hypothetical protein
MLRRGVGDSDLDIKWDAHQEREIARPEEEDAEVDYLRGCWVVTKKTKVWAHTVISPKIKLAHTKSFDWPVYVLDGRGGLPLDPGAWLVEIMVRSDLLRQGVDRELILDEAREKAARAERDVGDKAIKDFVSQRDLYRLMVKAADENGVHNFLKEEIAQMERDAEKMLEWDEDAFNAYLLEIRTRR